MSDQGPLPDRLADDFGLIETLLWTAAEGYALRPEHLARLAGSAAALGFAHYEGHVRAALAAAVAAPVAPRLRVRLVLSRDGTVETGATPIAPVAPETVWRVALAETRFDPADPLLRHKTTRRARYEEPLADASARHGADEVLFLNTRDELCETARGNLFIADGDALLTPSLASGLLPGTLRARLIAEGRAREAVLRIADLPAEFLVGNSVRGLVRATLID
jgi:4-amino-4-deoxychorismate lyase